MFKKISEFFSLKRDDIVPPKVELSTSFIMLNIKPLEIELSSLSNIKSVTKPDAVLPNPGNDDFGRLPLDVQLLILKHLTAGQLCQVARVSNYWNALSSLNVLWKSLAEDLSSLFGRYKLFEQTYKEDYKDKYIGQREFQKRLLTSESVLKQLGQTTLGLPELLSMHTLLRDYNFGQRPMPVEVVDTTIYAPDLHPFDDPAPSAEEEHTLKLLT